MDKPILVIGDLHLKLSNLETAGLFFDFVDETIKNEKVKTVIFLGDAYDGKAIIHADVQTFFIEKIKRLSACKIYIIIGNHDFSSTNLGNSSLTPLDLFENVTTVSECFVDGKCAMIAYGKPSDIEATLQRPEIRGKLVFGHFAVNGFMYGPKIVDDGIDPKFLTGPAILGHIHTPCDKGSICYLGSPWSHSFGEANQNKRLLLISDSGNKMIEMKDRLPKHITVDWKYKGISITNEGDFVRITNIPLCDRETAKINFVNFKNVSFEFLPEVNNDVRIDATKSYDAILKEYIDKNLGGSKVTKLDKEKLYLLGKRYLGV